MQALARYSLSGPWQAVLVISLLGIGAWMLFPLMYLSGALLALVAMQMGPGKASQVLLGGLVVQGIAGTVLMASPSVALALAAVIWVPIVALGGQVWNRASLPPALATVALLGLVAVVGFYLLHEDPGLWWQERLEHTMAVRAPDGLMAGGDADLATLIGRVAAYLPGAFAGVWVMGLAAGLVLGRWLQSCLYRPGAFGIEFQAWRLGKRWSGIVAACLFVASWRTDLAINLLVPLTVVLSLPAFGLMHALLQGRAGAKIWLGLLYAALLLMPHLVAVLAVVALLDGWLDFRARAPKI